MEPMFYEGDIVGSTPLARGTPNQFAITVIKIRFNPACAGNSSRHRRQLEKSTVQPRLRGELVSEHRSDLVRPQFNPACAGNSQESDNQHSGLSVQPRLRGELTKLRPTH